MGRLADDFERNYLILGTSENRKALIGLLEAPVHGLRLCGLQELRSWADSEFNYLPVSWDQGETEVGSVGEFEMRIGIDIAFGEVRVGCPAWGMDIQRGIQLSARWLMLCGRAEEIRLFIQGLLKETA